MFLTHTNRAWFEVQVRRAMEDPQVAGRVRQLRLRLDGTDALLTLCQLDDALLRMARYPVAIPPGGSDRYFRDEERERVERKSLQRKVSFAALRAQLQLIPARRERDRVLHARAQAHFDAAFELERLGETLLDGLRALGFEDLLVAPDASEAWDLRLDPFDAEPLTEAELAQQYWLLSQLTEPHALHERTEESARLSHRDEPTALLTAVDAWLDRWAPDEEDAEEAVEVLLELRRTLATQVAELLVTGLTCLGAKATAPLRAFCADLERLFLGCVSFEGMFRPDATVLSRLLHEGSYARDWRPTA